LLQDIDSIFSEMGGGSTFFGPGMDDFGGHPGFSTSGRGSKRQYGRREPQETMPKGYFLRKIACSRFFDITFRNSLKIRLYHTFRTPVSRV
jgi:hypothetical protein